MRDGHPHCMDHGREHRESRVLKSRHPAAPCPLSREPSCPTHPGRHVSATTSPLPSPTHRHRCFPVHAGWYARSITRIHPEHNTTSHSNLAGNDCGRSPIRRKFEALVSTATNKATKMNTSVYILLRVLRRSVVFPITSNRLVVSHSPHCRPN